MDMTRRAALRLVAAGPLLRIGGVGAGRGKALDLEAVKAAAWRVVPAVEGAGADAVRLTRSWDGPLCRSRLTNTGREPVRVREVVLFDLALGLPPETRLYGEGFQMLSQTGGTLGQPVDLGDYTDAKHYRIPRSRRKRARSTVSSPCHRRARGITCSPLRRPGASTGSSTCVLPGGSRSWWTPKASP